MDARRIRPLFLPPHPRRNRDTPIFHDNDKTACRKNIIRPLQVQDNLHQMCQP